MGILLVSGVDFLVVVALEQAGAAAGCTLDVFAVSSWMLTRLPSLDHLGQQAQQVAFVDSEGASHLDALVVTLGKLAPAHDEHVHARKDRRRKGDCVPPFQTEVSRQLASLAGEPRSRSPSAQLVGSPRGPRPKTAA